MVGRLTKFLLMAAVVVGCALGTGVASAAPKVKVTDDTKTPLNNGTLARVQKAIDAVGAPVVGGNIDVYVHVINNGALPANGNVSAAQIAAQIDVLNNAFGAQGWTFTLVQTDRTTNASWYSMGIGSAAEANAKQALRVGGARALNLYTAAVVDGMVGWSSLPWDYASNPKDDGVVLLYSALPGGAAAPYNLGDVAVHQVGHWMGLLHTFQGGCHGDGDYVSDTPAEAEPAFGFPAGRDSCPRDPGLDPIENYMDFSDDAGMSQFTVGQAARANAAMSVWR